MHRNITLKSILIFEDYIVFFKEFVESCIQKFLNNFRKAGEYRNGPVIILDIFCSGFVDGDDPGNFAIARKNTFSKHEVKKYQSLLGVKSTNHNIVRQAYCLFIANKISVRLMWRIK